MNYLKIKYNFHPVSEPIDKNYKFSKPRFLGEGEIEKSQHIGNALIAYQKPICIGHLSLAPCVESVTSVWDRAWEGEDVKIISYKQVFGNKKVAKRVGNTPQQVKKKFLAAMEGLLFFDLKTHKDLLVEKCQTFQLGENKCQTLDDEDKFVITEPNDLSCQEMVNRWLDKTFEAAEILRTIKIIMLEPLIQQIEQIKQMSGKVRYGDHSKVLLWLQRMTKETYILG